MFYLAICFSISTCIAFAIEFIIYILCAPLLFMGSNHLLNTNTKMVMKSLNFFAPNLIISGLGAFAAYKLFFSNIISIFHHIVLPILIIVGLIIEIILFIKFFSSGGEQNV